MISPGLGADAQEAVEQQVIAPRVIAVVGKADIQRARWLLLKLAEKFKGAGLTSWQKRNISGMATGVAMRRKRGQRPTLSQEQAMSLYSIVAGR